MNLLILYLLALLPGMLIPGCYFLLKKVFKVQEKVLKIIKIVLTSLSLATVAMMVFHVGSGAMFPSTIGQEYPNAGDFIPGSGNWELVGVPYGDNKFLNFLAWLISASFIPAAAVVHLHVFYPNKVSKSALRYIAAPTMLFETTFLFVYLQAWRNEFSLAYENIFIVLAIGSVFGLSVVLFLEELIPDLKNGEFVKPYTEKGYFKKHWKEVVYVFLFYSAIYVCSFPANTFAVLINVHTKIFGTIGTAYRIEEFYLMHRVFLYIAVICPITIYFVHRNQDVTTKRFLLIAISLGVLANFISRESVHAWFTWYEGKMYLNVKGLPIHLCHTALFIIPLCLAFNLKRLFYFTYFINVFGAIAAMLWPDTGNTTVFTATGTVQFWYNHIAAATMPLLCVALGIFEKPKMKQMLYSMGFFTAYLIIILFLNGWLSNYVNFWLPEGDPQRYDPNRIGSGTDYFFVNGTYVLDILSDQAFHLMDYKVSWTWGNCVFVFYPLYQGLFLLGYYAIMFGEWFIYSLFFRISDSHKELHDKLVIARQQHISLKEKLRMDKIENIVIDHNEANVKFINFSKRYGNSKRLSADHVNLEVKGGEIFGFLGPNGAGKSTCIKSAIGIQPVTDGKIEICGYDVTTQAVYAKKVTGYVPDHYALYEKLTGREYINYIADLYGVSKADRDERIAKYVDLFELSQAFDNKMQTYSHGMKQKMTIMAALVHEPKLWILDEPLTGLDPQSIYQVKECMKEHAAKGNVVFFSSHIIDVVEKLCTRIAIIKKGQIVYENSMQGVLKEHPEGLEEFYMKTIRDNGDMDE